MSISRPTNEGKYFSIVSSIFVATLLISNTIGGKIFTFYGLNLPSGVIVFPISYIFGDILTEVYGYKASRKIIWTGLCCLLLMSLSYYVAQILPPAVFWQDQKAFEAILGVAPRIAFASTIAYFMGEFSNSFVLAKLKVLTSGRHLWMRTISSTVVGQAVDTIVFCLIAFLGIFTPNNILQLVVSNYIFKVFYEAIATPVTYLIVGYLKKTEGVDIYDSDTDFNPFLITKE